jgi:hypothetical protein
VVYLWDVIKGGLQGALTDVWKGAAPKICWVQEQGSGPLLSGDKAAEVWLMATGLTNTKVIPMWVIPWGHM